MADLAATGTPDTTSADHATAPAAPTPSPSSSGAPPDTSLIDIAGETAAAFADYTEDADASGSPPDAPPDPSAQARAARAPDGPSEAGSQPRPSNGFVPTADHISAVENARKKGREDALAEAKQKWGWADGLNQADVQTSSRMYAWLQQDPRRFIAFVQNQLGPDGQSAAAAPADPEPEPDIPLTDGRFVYSAERMREWQAWNRRQLTQEFEKTYGPTRDRVQLQTLAANAAQEMSGMVAQARAEWPLFADNEAEIKAAIKKDERPITATTLHDAYLTVLRTVGLKKAQDRWEAERTGRLQQKAAATTVAPGAPRAVTPRADREKSTREITAEVFAD